MATIAVTIGTDDAWAPPKFVRFELGDDFVARNAESVRWRAEAKGRVTRCAVCCRGDWMPVPIPEPQEVVRRQDVVLGVGAIEVRFECDPISVDWPQGQLSGQRWLEDRRTPLLAS